MGGSEAWIGETLKLLFGLVTAWSSWKLHPLAHDVIDGIIKEAKAGLDKILRGKPNARISLRA